MALLQKPTEIVQRYGTNFGTPFLSSPFLSAMLPAASEHNSINFNNARKRVQTMIGGRLEFDEEKRRWYFIKNDGQRFPMGITAEGTTNHLLFLLLIHTS